MRHPSFNVTLSCGLLAFVGGITLAFAYHTPADTVIAAVTTMALAGAVMASITHLYNYPALFFILVAAVMMGAGWSTVAWHESKWDALEQMVPRGDVGICGIVSDQHPVPDNRDQHCIIIDVAHIHRGKKGLIQTLPCKISCYVYWSNRRPIGSPVSLAAVDLKQAAISTKPHFKHYLRREGVFTSVFNTQLETCICSHQAVIPPTAWHYSYLRWMHEKRQTLFRDIHKKFSLTAKYYSSLMFYGNKYAYATDNMRLTFSFWGLSHFLARAGLHIVIFVFIFSFLLGLLPIHARYKDMIMLILCILYDVMSWASLPFLRAWYAAVLVIIKRLLHRHTTYFYLLSITFLGMLIANPYHLLLLDFQLSYGLTFMLIFLSRVAHQKYIPVKNSNS